MSLIDRRQSAGGIGTCTPLEKGYGRGDRRHVPTWNGDAAKWESVEYNLAARLVSGLSGPARMTCMTMGADQLHPPPGDGPMTTADERRNKVGLDNVMNVLQMSPLVKKLLTLWQERHGVGIDIVTALPDVAG